MYSIAEISKNKRFFFKSLSKNIINIINEFLMVSKDEVIINKKVINYDIINFYKFYNGWSRFRSRNLLLNTYIDIYNKGTNKLILKNNTSCIYIKKCDCRCFIGTPLEGKTIKLYNDKPTMDKYNIRVGDLLNLEDEYNLICDHNVCVGYYIDYKNKHKIFEIELDCQI